MKPDMVLSSVPVVIISWSVFPISSVSVFRRLWTTLVFPLRLLRTISPFYLLLRSVVGSSFFLFLVSVGVIAFLTVITATVETGYTFLFQQVYRFLRLRFPFFFKRKTETEEIGKTDQEIITTGTEDKTRDGIMRIDVRREDRNGHKTRNARKVRNVNALQDQNPDRKETQIKRNRKIMKNLLRNSLFCLLGICLMAACNENTVYHSYQSLPDEGWGKSDTLSFLIPVTDSIPPTLRLFAEFVYFLILLSFNSDTNVIDSGQLLIFHPVHNFEGVISRIQRTYGFDKDR